MSKVGIFGAGWVGLVTGRLLRRARPRRRRARRRPRADRARCSAARPDPRAGPGRADRARTGERLAFTLDAGRGAEDAEFLFVCVGTPPTYSGDADLSARLDACSTSCPQLDERPMLVMKSTVPVGTGEKVRAALDARGLERRRLRLEPRVPRRGHRRARLHEPRPDRRRRVRGRGRRPRRRALRARSTRRSCAPTSPPRR